MRMYQHISFCHCLLFFVHSCQIAFSFYADLGKNKMIDSRAQNSRLQPRLSSSSLKFASHWHSYEPGWLTQVWEQFPLDVAHSSISEHVEVPLNTKPSKQPHLPNEAKMQKLQIFCV